MRFASRENTALAQVEVGSGVHPGGGGTERLSTGSSAGARARIVLGRTTSTARPLNDTDTSIGRFGQRTGRLRGCTRAPNCQLLIVARSRQRRICINTSRCHPPTAARRASHVYDGADVPEAQQRFQALFKRGLNHPGDMEDRYGELLGTLMDT